MIHCPYCQHAMEIKGAKPGRFGPTCPACKKKFALLVSEDPEDEPVVKAIAQKPVEKVPTVVEDALGMEKTPIPKAVGAPSVHPQIAKPQTAKTQVDARTVVPPVASAQSVAPKPAPARTQVAPPPHVKVPITHESIPPEPVGLTEDRLPPGTSLGGYQLVQKLGEGGMGAVYLARQMSLDRDVAVKVMAPFLSSDPQFVARFTREAYAAAQLGHHNVVQIHDIGAQKDTHFFSMEFVEGQSLAHLVRDQGPIDPEVAVGYILQAARGLKFAHDHGMIHRDIKPENLLLNDQGIVKVADLGLVKRRDVAETNITNAPAQPDKGGHTTQLHVAMGTPAYMAPEQASDAANVDARADIYSLGCTLYDLLVARPPFEGKTAVEVMTKHQTQAIVPPDKIVSRVPPSLSEIVGKMVAKRPEDRFSNMGEVIKALEEWLGVDSAKGFSPKAEHAKAMENCSEWFNNSSFAKLRRNLVRGYFVGAVLFVFVIAWLTGSFKWTGGAVGFVILTPVIYIVLSGITQRAHLLSKLRELVFGARIVDWLGWILAIVLFIGVLIMLGLQWAWLGFAIAAAAVACGFHFSLDLMVANQRKKPIEQTENLLKNLRLKGLDEDSLRQFVCRYSGNDWEEFYEALFGFEDKMLAREKWARGQRGKTRKRYAGWREPLIRWIDHKQQVRHERRQRKHLEAIERKSLKAQGMLDNVANKKAKRAAETMVFRAAKLRDESAKAAAMTVAPPTEQAGAKRSAAPTLSAKKVDINTLVQVRVPIFDDDETESKEVEREHESYFKRRYGGPIEFLLGPKIRFLAAAVILVGSFLWMKQNDLLPTSATAQQVKAAIDRPLSDAADPTRAGTAFDQQTEAQRQAAKANKYKPLDFKLVPDFITHYWQTYAQLVAGIILLISVPFRGSKFTILIIAAAAVAFLGERFIPNVTTLLSKDRLAMAGGGALALLTLMFFRK